MSKNILCCNNIYYDEEICLMFTRTKYANFENTLLVWTNRGSLRLYPAGNEQWTIAARGRLYFWRAPLHRQDRLILPHACMPIM